MSVPGQRTAAERLKRAERGPLFRLASANGIDPEPPFAVRQRSVAHLTQGLATIDEALARSERSEERWSVAELLRIKGELVVLQGASGAKRVTEEHFRQSLDWARRQGALSWELRSAASLARLLRDQRHSAEARSLLQPVYDRFIEGFDAADLKAAKGLLDSLQ
jgi:predicted ATPase